MSAPPSIPPRPSRSQNSNPPQGASMDVPKIPPRPKRSVDRSVSPGRDAFARSPLNDPSFLHNGQQQNKGSRLSVELPPRPPSVTLPTLGQEGSEYESFEDLSKTFTSEQEASPQQTTAVAGDLPLHAPKASVPSSTAKSRIQTVTRTDSQTAVAAGIGKLVHEDKSTQGSDSARPSSSAGGNTRPSSVYKGEEEEHGIPEIGVQVPMYPNAGDVQAPTPSPYDQAPATGVGFFNKGDRPASGRHHGRTKSGREIFHAPPGSYGRHGHGVIPNDDFEKNWYEKHPEDLKREKAGEYGPHIQENRKDYHWGGEDLNKLVHTAASKGGMGTSADVIGTPDEQVGYIASEEYASRMASPRPPSGRPGSISGKAAAVAESPLRQTAFSTEQLAGQKTRDDEAGEDVIHVDPPAHRLSKVTGDGYEAPTEDLGPEGGNTDEKGGWVTDRGYGVPILASDELQKRPGSEYRQPAISPELERRGSGEYFANEDGTSSKQRTHSRSSSRNNPAGGRFIPSPYGDYDRSGTPLESHKEYEPLFPEDEDKQQKPKTAADKLKRPELARHHFPSQDVWEDTPSSLQLETTVETPQAPEELATPVDAPPAKVFEKPESEQARKSVTEEEQKSFLPDKKKPFVNKNLSKEHLEDPSRPGMQQRFPSQDIWEDAPEHGQLETTVSVPQTEETGEYADDSPVTDKPPVPARPSIPARPQKKQEASPVDKKAPILPERPKPQVPARPAKPATKSSENVPTLESHPGEEATQPKAKPAVPARPAGSKIAALQAGFLKDLNSKLGLGPQAPKVKEPEPEEEKEKEAPKPLQDARKGRAKGPRGRKAATAPAPATSEAPKQSFVFAPVTTVWSIGDDGAVDVPAAAMAAKIQEVLKKPEVEQVEDKQEEAEVPLEKAESRENVAVEADSKESIPSEVQEEVTEDKTEDPVAPLDATGGVPLEKKSSVDDPVSVAGVEVEGSPELKTSSERIVAEPVESKKEDVGGVALENKEVEKGAVEAQDQKAKEGL